jgi:hypothetical protein
MQITIEIPDDMTQEEVSVMARLLQRKADQAVKDTFNSVANEVLRLMKQHKEFMGQPTDHMLTDAERLAWSLGEKPSSICSDFAFSFAVDNGTDEYGCV